MWLTFQDQDLVVVGVDQGGLYGGDSAAIVQQFLEQTGVTFPVGWDRNNSYGAFNTGPSISPFPLDVIVDKEGKIAYIATEYDANAIRTTVEQLLAR